MDFKLCKYKLIEALLTALDKNACLKLILGYSRLYVGNLLTVKGYTALLDSTSALRL